MFTVLASDNRGSRTWAKVHLSKQIGPTQQAQNTCITCANWPELQMCLPGQQQVSLWSTKSLIGIGVSSGFLMTVKCHYEDYGWGADEIVLWQHTWGSSDGHRIDNCDSHAKWNKTYSHGHIFQSDR